MGLHTVENDQLDNTLVGTIPGALPVWMGWTAADRSLMDCDGFARCFYRLAVATLYGDCMDVPGAIRISGLQDDLGNGPISGRGASWHAILGSIALIVFAVMVIPPTTIATAILCALNVALAVWQLYAAIRFAKTLRLIVRKMLHVSSFTCH